MSTCAAIAIGFSVAGGLSEIAGLGLVVRGIARDRQRAEGLVLERPPRRSPRREYPPHMHGSSGVGGSMGTFWHMQSGQRQMEQIVALVRKVEAAAGNILIDMRKALDQERDQLGEELRDEMDRSAGTLREGLSYVLAGSIRERQLGAGLLAAGIVLAATGSVMGTVAT